AVKFTPGGGRVRVCSRWVEGVGPHARPVPLGQARAVRFDVEDTGPGIDPLDQGRIGNEFYQGRRGQGQAAEGTGVGRGRTRRAARRGGGACWCRSAVGQGSTFSFALPLQPARPQPAEGAGGGPPETGRPAALVVEDHVPTNKLLTDWLLEAGLEVAS